ncbi:hypothetical protein [Phaeobacter inhibens]|uniref:hypothetical protein n=1 Tax=Phaeobacter inhibens TaxID=221822 RepID=UPI0001632BC1|nr:hypothetical protein [Phaeobacter inhibens]AFO91525.1 hypothetical protein PGA1_c18280 [Phaeobacter inhibens DSM 17395]AUQ46192.1 hypothetical protein PhaeoP10_01854 [Phaeobacter inhibens]
MTTLAFYKGKGTAVDRAIRWATRGEFSHVELADLDRGLGLSASARDGGVRVKAIDFASEHWAVVEAPWIARGTSWARAAEHTAAPYDYLGIFGSHALALSRHYRDAWFCSELCAYALGLDAPQSYSPQGLFRAVTFGRQAFRAGDNIGN